MTIEDALYQYLSGYVPLTTMVGNRIYNQVMPEGEKLPAVVFQEIIGPRVYSLAGPSNLEQPHYQFSCYAMTAKEAKAVMRQVKAAFDAFVLPGTMATGIRVVDITVEEQSDFYDGLTRVYHAPVDVSVWYSTE